MASGGKNWSVEETEYLLNILKEKQIVERLDGRKVRNNELFKEVYEEMQLGGFSRSVEQIKNRWKLLKTAYHKAKAQNSSSGCNPSNFPFYDIINSFMGERPIANTDDNGVDVGFPEDLPTENETDNSAIDNADSCSEESIENTFTEDFPLSSTETTSSLHEETSSQGSRKRKRPTSRMTSRYEKAIHAWSTEQQSFLERMQETQNDWMERQLERNQQHEERLLMTLAEENSRSTERLVGQLLSGLSGILKQTSNTAPYMHTRPIPMFQPHPQTQQSYSDRNVLHSHSSPSSTDHYSFMNL